VTEAPKEPPSRKLLWYVIGSVVALGVGAIFTWLTGVLDPPDVEIAVQDSLQQPGSLTYDNDGNSHVTSAQVKIKNTWSKALKNVEVHVSIVPSDKIGEMLSVSYPSNCRGGAPNGPDILGFYDVTMQCEFLAPKERAWLTLGFPNTRIRGLKITVRSPEKVQEVEQIFDRHAPT
jgi:hypothetical protein